MISVTVPVYNEAESLPILAERVTSVLGKLGQPWELIFINDGSADGSEEVLDRIAAENPAVKVVHFRRNYGQTAAMMAGFDFAAIQQNAGAPAPNQAMYAVAVEDAPQAVEPVGGVICIFQ